MASFSAPGTGASPYILPADSKAADRLLDTIDYNQKVNQYNQQQKQQQAANMAKSYKDNAAKATYGTLWQDELNGLFQQHMEQGQKYAQAGFDVYNPNPNNNAQVSASNQLMNDRRNIYSLQDTRDQFQKEFLEDQNLLAKAPAGKYDANSIKAQHDFITNHTLQDIQANHLQLPRIQEAFNPDTTILPKLNDAIAMTGEQEYDKNGHRITTNAFKVGATTKNIEGLFQANPGGADYIQQQTGISPQQAKALPNALPDITKLNDAWFKGTPTGRQALISAGVTSFTDPKYQDLLNQKSQSDFQSKQKYNQLIGGYVDMARAKAKEVHKDVPDWEGLNYQRELNKDNAKDQPGEVVFGNGESMAPVVTQNVDNKGQPTTHTVKGKQVSGGYATPAQGATLFTQEFPQTKITTTPGSYVDINSGHNVKNDKPFEVTVGSVKMEPVWTGRNDNIDGTVMSKDALMDAIQNKNGRSLNNISFNPMVYGERPQKDPKTGKVQYQPVSFPYDAVRGNNKIKSAKFEQTEQQFKELIASPDFQSMDANQRFEFLSKYYNIK